MVASIARCNISWLNSVQIGYTYSVLAWSNFSIAQWDSCTIDQFGTLQINTDTNPNNQLNISYINIVNNSVSDDICVEYTNNLITTNTIIPFSYFNSIDGVQYIALSWCGICALVDNTWTLDTRSTSWSLEALVTQWVLEARSTNWSL